MKQAVGIVLCVAGITLVHQNQWIIGLPLFLIGITLLLGGKRR